MWKLNMLMLQDTEKKKNMNEQNQHKCIIKKILFFSSIFSELHCYFVKFQVIFKKLILRRQSLSYSFKTRLGGSTHDPVDVGLELSRVKKNKKRKNRM